MEMSYDEGYQDGWCRKAAKPCTFNEYLNRKYMNGYNKGKADRDFCDIWSDEALGVADYGQ